MKPVAQRKGKCLVARRGKGGYIYLSFKTFERIYNSLISYKIHILNKW